MKPDFATQLEQAKLKSLQELAYGAGHEVNNPLANISARAQLLIRDETHPEKLRALRAIHRQAMRAHEMIADLMLFAQPPELVLESTNLADLSQQAIDELDLQNDPRSVSLTTNGDLEKLTLQGDCSQLIVAIRALLTNAVEATAPGGTIAISVGPLDKSSLELTVQDNGSGVPDSIRPHLFDPFYSGREAGRGLGFGLSKCWRIITEHGGTIAVDSPAKGGALFTICLPR